MARKTKETVRDFWDNNTCGTLFTSKKEMSKTFYEEIERHRYTQHPYLKSLMQFDGYKGKKILEIGIGVGTDLRQFAKAGASVTGVDLTPNSVKIAKKGFELYGLNGKFRVADAEHLPFNDNSFDVVYSCGVLHHTPNTQKAINEVYRVLKPGGEAAIMLYNKRSWTYYVVILLYNGLIRGKWFGKSTEELVAQNTDGDACPIAKVYTKGQALKLFRKFTDIRVRVRYLAPQAFPVLNCFIPQAFFDKLGYLIGWNMFIFAKK